MMNRRTLLQMAGLGGGAALTGLPWLSRVPSAHAQSDVRRLVIVTLPNEPINRDYWGVGASGEKNLPITALAHDVMSPLAPYMDQLRIIGDTTNQVILDKNWHSDSSHFGILYALTGVPAIPFANASKKGDEWAGGESIDQFIAERLGSKTLTLGVGCRNFSKSNHGFFHKATQQVVAATAVPQDAFDDVFGQFEVSDEEFAKRGAQRTSVMDVVAADLKNLSGRLPSDDRLKLDRHLSDLRDLELKLNELGTLGCNEVPPAPGSVTSNDLPRVARAQMDVLVQALRCDMHRVIGLQYGGSGTMLPSGPWNWSDELYPVVTTESEHEVAHRFNGAGTASQKQERRDLQKHYYGQLAYLLDQLASVPEGSGTMLDSTLVMLVHVMGFRHKQTELLHLFAGGGNFIKTGQFDSYPGKPHNQVLAGVCRAMGMNDVTSYGDPDYSGYIDLT